MSVNSRLKRYNWHKADFVAIEQYLCNIDWTKFICSNPCVLSSWAAFLDLIWTSVEEFVPQLEVALNLVDTSTILVYYRSLLQKNVCYGKEASYFLLTCTSDGNIVIVLTNFAVAVVNC